MKKYSLLFFILFLLTAISCEKDDFCTDPKTTPKLILRFYDKDNPENLKKANRLSAIAISKTDSLFISNTTDSIALPLNTLNTKTEYILKINTSNNNNTSENQIATIRINYTTENEFISRSCGFRVIYNDVNLTHLGTWISNISTNTITSINSQTNAHVKVYH